MKWAVLFLIFLAFQLLPGIHAAVALSQSDIYLSSRTIPQGGLGLIKIRVEKGEIPQVTWMRKEIYLVPNHQKTDWDGFLGVDLATKPGRYEVLVKILPSGLERHLEIEILEKDYGVRRLTLPKDMVDLDKETLKRAKKEARIMKKIWDAPPSTPRWRGPFLRPILSEVVGPFGRRSIINNQPRARHSGIDLKAGRGDPIRAINNGRVVLTSDHFFSGMSVVIDHGGGIQSMYFHMDRIMVQKGQMVTKGRVIGLAGSTGRASGPHLHWGLRINGARVDPLRLTFLSQQLEG